MRTEKLSAFKRNKQNQLNDDYKRNEAFSEIVSYLDSAAGFDEIINRILNIVGNSLGVSNAGMMNIVDGDRFEIFSEWTKDDKMELFDRARDDIWDESIVYPVRNLRIACETCNDTGQTADGYGYSRL